MVGQQPWSNVHYLPCWIELSSSSPRAQLRTLGIARCVFLYLDWGALRVKQMLAAEVNRLGADKSCPKCVHGVVSRILRELSEIRALAATHKSSQTCSQCGPSGGAPAWHVRWSRGGSLQKHAVQCLKDLGAALGNKRCFTILMHLQQVAKGTTYDIVRFFVQFRSIELTQSRAGHFAAMDDMFQFRDTSAQSVGLRCFCHQVDPKV